MATTLLYEKPAGKGSISQSGNRLIFKDTYNLVVVSDSIYTTREEVLVGTVGLPIVGLKYGLYNLICKSIDATRWKDAPLYWDVTCEFENGVEDQKQDSQNNPDSRDPTTWIPIFKIDSFELKEKVITNDLSTPSKAILNSAGTQFDHPVTRMISLCSFSGSQFEDPSTDFADIMERNDTVNDTAFKVQIKTRAARTLKLNVIGAELGSYGGFDAWRVTYKFTYDRDTWDLRLLDVGPQYLSGTTRLDFLSDLGNYKIIGALNGSGGKATDQTKPSERRFQTIKAINFSNFIRT